MDLITNSRLLPHPIRLLTLLAGGTILLTACLAPVGTPATVPVAEVDASPPPPSPTSTPTAEPDTPTPSSTPTATVTASTVPISPTVLPLPSCPSSGILYLDPIGYDEEWRFFVDLYWVCSGDSLAQLVTSGVEARHIVASPEGDRVAFVGEVIQIMDLSSALSIK